jgi:hypothetical protein
MQYFGLGSSLFIVAAVVTLTHFYLNTPDELHDKYVSAEPVVDKSIMKEVAFAKQIRSAFSETRGSTLTMPLPNSFKSTNVHIVTSKQNILSAITPR